MADEHEVVHLRIEAFDPRRGVVVRSQGVALLNIGAQQSTPRLSRLTGPGLAGVDDASRPHAELVDRPTSHTRNVLGALVCERPLRVFVLGLGLPMLNEKELHGHNGRTVRPAGAEGSEPTRTLQIGKTPVTSRSPIPGLTMHSRVRSCTGPRVGRC
jgi:hypothetical protein